MLTTRAPPVLCFPRANPCRLATRRLLCVVGLLWASVAINPATAHTYHEYWHEEDENLEASASAVAKWADIHALGAFQETPMGGPEFGGWTIYLGDATGATGRIRYEVNWTLYSVPQHADPKFHRIDVPMRSVAVIEWQAGVPISVEPVGEGNFGEPRWNATLGALQFKWASSPDSGAAGGQYHTIQVRTGVEPGGSLGRTLFDTFEPGNVTICCTPKPVAPAPPTEPTDEPIKESPLSFGIVALGICLALLARRS